MPRWAQSIRFRLSLAYALAVFATGAVFVAAVYLWQLHELDQPIMMRSSEVVFQKNVAGEQYETRLRFLSQSEVNRVFLEQFERNAYRQALTELRRASLVGLGLLSVVAFASGWLLSGWSLRPMGRMAAVARDISASELSRRIALQGPNDELKDLADTFDEMLDRLQASFEGQRQFVEDASHELRNPLAVAQANLELVIDDAEASPAELRRAAEIAHASTSRVSQIVEDLVAQARHRVPRAAIAPVDLRVLSEEVAAEMSAEAARRGIRVLADGPVGSDARQPLVNGDGAALRRAVTNLVANAVRLAPPDSAITISTGVRDHRAIVSVSDQGPGIDPRDHEAVFERFWRGDAAGKGLGLGLSIVRQVAQRHGGTVELVSARGQGSTFTIALPMPMAVAVPATAADLR